jgi:hypothetical protein
MLELTMQGNYKVNLNPKELKTLGYFVGFLFIFYLKLNFKAYIYRRYISLYWFSLTSDKFN